MISVRLARYDRWEILCPHVVVETHAVTLLASCAAAALTLSGRQRIRCELLRRVVVAVHTVEDELLMIAGAIVSALRIAVHQQGAGATGAFSRLTALKASRRSAVLIARLPYDSSANTSGFKTKISASLR